MALPFLHVITGNLLFTQPPWTKEL